MLNSPATRAAPAIAVLPEIWSSAFRLSEEEAAYRRANIEDAVVRASGTLVEADRANGVVWLQMGDPSPLIQTLNDNPAIGWVQLPWAGVENFLQGGLFNREVRFTSAKGAFATQVAEHAVMQMMVGLRNVVRQSRTKSWLECEPESLSSKRVTVLGGGGIASELVRLLQPFDCDITVLRRHVSPVPHATRTLSIDQLDNTLPETDVLALALALTDETRGIIGAKQLELLPQGAVIANVARGGHIDTSALLLSLESGHLGAACLDVTDPEPLPDAHPLWRMDNVFISSHCADSLVYVTHQLAQRVYDNVVALATDQPLVGEVNRQLGY